MVLVVAGRFFPTILLSKLLMFWRLAFVVSVMSTTNSPLFLSTLKISFDLSDDLAPDISLFVSCTLSLLLRVTLSFRSIAPIGFICKKNSIEIRLCNSHDSSTSQYLPCTRSVWFPLLSLVLPLYLRNAYY